MIEYQVINTAPTTGRIPDHVQINPEIQYHACTFAWQHTRL